MYGRNLKITTRLIISTAAFLLPLGIMLFSVISISHTEIQKRRNELKGLETLRPAVSLMQIVPLYIRFTMDDVGGDSEYARQNASELISDLSNKYEKYFGTEAIVVSPNTLLEYWDYLQSARIRDNIMWTYRQFINDLCKLIVYIGDISNLTTDSELECVYLVQAAVHDLPQAQERIISIGNYFRLIEAGAFTQRRKIELDRELELLVYADNAQIQKRINAAVSLRMRNTEAPGMLEGLLNACYVIIANFANTVSDAFNTQTDTQVLYALHEAAGRANNAAYQLQNASFNRLETLVLDRIKTSQTRLIISLLAAIATTIIAFIIIFVTMLNIRKSTNIMGRVFKRLDENDLSVKVDVLSRDELGNFMEALSGFLEKLKSAFTSFNRNASMVSTAVYELSSSSKEITTTANEQSSSVAEIVSTMESNKNLSSQVAVKTVEVAQMSVQTQELSRRGADLRDANENMMLDIRNQNAKIIDIIKNLADMLSRIDESVQLIDTIADHTKLIAFNAALEASSSGEAGLRFAVVAGEIRRFADNVVESVVEIKEKISELQDASQELIAEANNGSRAIDTGYTRMVEQKEVFENIVDVSQNVAVFSQQISNLSRQQELASAQVFTALKEISAGVNQFVTVTAMTSATVDKLNSMSIELKETLAKYQTTK